MVFSPALAHRQRTLAAIAAGSETASQALPEIDESNPAAAEYRQLLASLHNDVRALSEIQSHDARLPKKAEMLTTYLPWITGALASDPGEPSFQDDIIATAFIWHVDLAQWVEALLLARHMIERGIALPSYGNFKRPPAIFLVDRAAEMAKKDPKLVPLDVLLEISDFTAGHDMRDESRAALLRAIGHAHAAAAETYDPQAASATAGGQAALVEAALTSLNAALRLDAKVGVKKDIEKLERLQRKLAPPASSTQE